MVLEFTPLEFETKNISILAINASLIRIYSVGVWNEENDFDDELAKLLEFTPLEFETLNLQQMPVNNIQLEFTPLEFETFFSSFFFVG